MLNYVLSDQIVYLVAKIVELVTKIPVSEEKQITPHLRRRNRVKAIQASLAIENNSLSIDQVNDIFDGKEVLGPPREIREVQNAFRVYDMLPKLRPGSEPDLLRAHQVLMKDLMEKAGVFREGKVGIFSEARLVYMAPPADEVPELIEKLLKWTRDSKAHPLIKSCVFHYELEFIHPFTDGNGRMGRVWQTLILSRWKTIFGWLPVESLIKDKQKEYYQALGRADQTGDSAPFIEFMLEVILKALKEMTKSDQVTVQVSDQVKKLLEVIKKDEVLSGKELMRRLKLRHRPTFRTSYLLPAIEQGLVELTVPEKPNSSQQKYRLRK